MQKCKIEMVQRRAARWTTGNFDRRASVTSMFQELGWRSLEKRRVDSRLTLLFKIAHGLAPTCHSDQLHLPTRRSRQMREHSFLPLPCHTTSHRLSFFPRTISQWNSLPDQVFTNCNSAVQFRKYIPALNHAPVNLL